MAKGKLITAPNYDKFEGPVIFLAGPIQGARRWQDDAIEYILENSDGINVASPRRPLDRKKRKGPFTDEMYNEQVDWETHHLQEAGKNGVVLFWLANEKEHMCERAYAQTSRFELAEWKMKHEKDGSQLVVGIEDDFTGARYIRRRMSQDCPEVQILDNLEKTCQAAIDLIKNK